MDELIAAVQVADTKAPGGIEAAVEHYAAMFDAVGAASVFIYRGLDRARLEANGVSTLEPGSGLFAPWTGLLPHASLRKAVLARLGREPTLSVVHADRALEGVRRAFPQARIVTPCHSDKFKRKRRALHPPAPRCYPLSDSGCRLATRIPLPLRSHKRFGCGSFRTEDLSHHV